MARKSSENKTIKIVKNIPSSETGSQTICTTRTGEKYIISNCPEKHRFTLWRVVEDGYEKMATSETPLVFDKMIDINGNWLPPENMRQ